MSFESHPLKDEKLRQLVDAADPTKDWEIDVDAAWGRFRERYAEHFSDPINSSTEQAERGEAASDEEVAANFRAANSHPIHNLARIGALPAQLDVEVSDQELSANLRMKS